jgi:RNA polymerase sigma-70 factor (ECF subfamily)
MGGRRNRDHIREVFERFCVDEYPRLVVAVALVVGDTEAAADAVNEALARAWNRVRRGHDIDSLGAWIRVVAINVGYDYHRRRALENKHYGAFLERDHPEHNASWEISLDVRDALAALPKRQREVAVLHYLCDLSVATIAEELHISPGTVKTNLQRARVALQHSLVETRDAEEVLRYDA